MHNQFYYGDVVVVVVEVAVIVVAGKKLLTKHFLTFIYKKLMWHAYSASSVIQTLIYLNSPKLVNFHEFYYNLQDGGHLVTEV